MCEEAGALPFHVAHKRVAFIDETGEKIESKEPNACKFERFVFDALPLAARATVMETRREREFAPVKNAAGEDSPESARRLMSAEFARWLRESGADIDGDPDGAPVEIGPLFALDADEFAEKTGPESVVKPPYCFDESWKKLS